MQHSVYLSAGSNLGDRIANLQKGIKLLNNHPQIELIKESAYYQTSPVGGVLQDDFINQAIHIKTSLDPYHLLDYLHQIEAELLRKRIIIWGPRTLDLDIIFYDDQISEDPDLTLPHPQAFNRLFVLIPLLEIMNPNTKEYPVIQQAIQKLEAEGYQKIERVGIENERN